MFEKPLNGEVSRGLTQEEINDIQGILEQHFNIVQDESIDNGRTIFHIGELSTDKQNELQGMIKESMGDNFDTAIGSRVNENGDDELVLIVTSK